MKFRDALPHEAAALTQLTLASKAYWGYPDEWLAIWTDELTINAEYIEKNMVVVAADDEKLLGYIAISEKQDGFFLDFIFIHPAQIKKGIGEKLVAIALNWCRDKQIPQLYVYSDPNSRGFYEKTGAVYVAEIPSEKIPGRTLPLLLYKP